TASVRRMRLRIGSSLPFVSVRIFFMYPIISYRTRTDTSDNEVMCIKSKTAQEPFRILRRLF
ncbi:MAG: hypothetical protein Q8P17_05190, partial [bacterium]|nr:hypothetical protein [bacterium]